MGDHQGLPTTECQATTSTPPRTPSPTPAKPVSPSRTSQWRSYLQTDISLVHADIPIIACGLITGLCDSSAYNAWSCFVSMQTGNTIFLALGASNQPVNKPYGWVKSLVSISIFLLGCLLFSLTRYIGAMRRGTLTVSFAIQALCIFVAAGLVQGRVVPSPDGLSAVPEGFIDFKELIPLGFLAFQFGGQIVTSRLLAFNEVPTVVLTSVYCDIASDPKVLQKDNVKRNRRVGAVISVLIGGIVGGWLSRSDAGMSTALWIAGAIKIIIAVAWSIWKAKSVVEI